MSYVITSSCAACLDGGCVDACPVDAIHGKHPLAVLRASSLPEQLYIDPERCICCAACEPECPAGAIFDEDRLPAGSRGDAERNRAFFRVPIRGS
jgi:ferredoxin